MRAGSVRKMKVLWYTNVPLAGLIGAHGTSRTGSGNWMVALLAELAETPEIELAVACATPGTGEGEKKSFSGNVTSYTIPQGPARRLLAFSNRDAAPRFLRACAEIAGRIHPDIIHVHGTERFYGLLGARRLVAAPVVISLQGLIHEYARFRHFFGVTTLRDIVAMHDVLHVFRGLGPLFTYCHYRRLVKRELEILGGNLWFMGRTLWDRSHLTAINPEARYFHVPEMLRPEFLAAAWDINRCRRHRIVFTNAGLCNRGTEILLAALAILKREYPDARLALAGNLECSPYGKRLKRTVEALNLSDSVEWLGFLDGAEVAAELRKSHVFAIASLVENSPNSLCEAQAVGIPCVASYVGGIPSLIDEGRTGLFFPPGDAPMLAERIRQVFQSDETACSLGERARQVARLRHDPAAIKSRVLEVYDTVIRQSRESQTVSNALR